VPCNLNYRCFYRQSILLNTVGDITIIISVCQENHSYNSFLISSSNSLPWRYPMSLFTILPFLSIMKAVGIPRMPPKSCSTCELPYTTG